MQASTILDLLPHSWLLQPIHLRYHHTAKLYKEYLSDNKFRIQSGLNHKISENKNINHNASESLNSS
ncbi:UNVERIFIED_CONTAM: hypothetical protein BJ099_101189 [Lysinibacillus xylanilyticus]